MERSHFDMRVAGKKLDTFNPIHLEFFLHLLDESLRVLQISAPGDL